MKKLNTAPIAGTLELLPETQAVFDETKAKIAKTFRAHGFLPIETPAIDRNEILFAKAGGDTEKQIYRVTKTTEAVEDSDQSLRFDHTVPLARYTVEHESSLTFPFLVSQIGKNFRGERPQKGRYREFYQCDIDVIGRNFLPLGYDTEVVATLIDALQSFIDAEMVVRVSNRQILSGLIGMLKLETVADDIYSIIDHSEKVPAEKTEASFREVLEDGGLVKLFLNLIEISGSAEEANQELLGFMNSQVLPLVPEKESPEHQAALKKFTDGVDQLVMVLGTLERDFPEVPARADLKIVRGLDYYTGTVFETVLTDHPEIGSVCSGGRYENLCENYSDQKFPGVGGSIGLTRQFMTLLENGLLKTAEKGRKLDIAIIPIDPEQLPAARKLAASLRETDMAVTLVLTDKKLGDRLTYAAKIAQAGVVLGEQEVETGVAKLRSFDSGMESDLPLAK